MFYYLFILQLLATMAGRGYTEKIYCKKKYIYAQNNYWYLMTHSDDILLFEFQSPQERVISLL